METQKTAQHLEIVYDPRAYLARQDLRDYIDHMDWNILARSLPPCIVVLGGDGALLRTIAHHHNRGLPFLPINFWTKGFLLNDRNHVHPGMSYTAREYPLLAVRVHAGDHEYDAIAFNEVVVKCLSGNILDLDIALGDRLALQLRGDGVLVSTPAGSTAYATSAGGLSLPYDSSTFVLAPLLPFEPRGIRPILYRDDRTLAIATRLRPQGRVAVHIDGAILVDESDIDIVISVRRSPETVQLLIAGDDIDLWDDRIYCEQGFHTPSISDIR